MCSTDVEDRHVTQHMHNALSGTKQFGKDAKTLRNAQRGSDTRTHTHREEDGKTKRGHCARAATRQSVLSVLVCDHEDGVKKKKKGSKKISQAFPAVKGPMDRRKP